MPATRNYFPKAHTLYRAWRHWESIWSWGNVLLGGLSTGLGALVAANTKTPFMCPAWSVGVAVAVPILTFLLSTLKPQAQASAFKTAGRELEKALHVYEGDETKDDTYLTDAIGRGIDILNKAAPPS
jgi:hypothetical protein